MCDPPKDTDGSTLPHDDADIASEHRVIRRVPPDQWVDRGDGTFSVSSGLFSASSEPNGSMSVDVEEKLKSAGLSIEKILEGTRYGAVALSVGRLRESQHKVGCDPLPDNKYHGGVWGNFTPGAKKKIKKFAEMLLAPKVG